MPFDSSRVEAVFFDSFSTVVDVHTAKEKLAKYVDDPERVSRRWRARIWLYRPLCNFLGWKGHHEVNRAALDHVFDREGVRASDAEREEIARVYYEMEPFADT